MASASWAFSAGIGLGFDDTDASGRASTRRTEPRGLLVEPPVWYVLSRDIDKGEPRTFRVDRISRPRLLQKLRFRPTAEVIRAQLPDSGHSPVIVDRLRAAAGAMFKV